MYTWLVCKCFSHTPSHQVDSHMLDKKWKAFSRIHLGGWLYLPIMWFILYSKRLKNFWNLERRKQRAKMYWWGIGPTGEVNSSSHMYWRRNLTVKKQFAELIYNWLFSLTQFKSVTDIAEIFGYTDTGYIDKKAYGELNTFAHPSTTEAAIHSPFWLSSNSHTDTWIDNIHMIIVCRE